MIPARNNLKIITVNRTWSAPVRPLFRVLAFLLGILSLPLGLLILMDGIRIRPFDFDSSMKFGIAASAMGIMCLVISIRGRLKALGSSLN